MSAYLPTRATSSMRTEVTSLFYLYLFSQLLIAWVAYNKHLLIEQMCALMNGCWPSSYGQQLNICPPLFNNAKGFPMKHLLCYLKQLFIFIIKIPSFGIEVSGKHDMEKSRDWYLESPGFQNLISSPNNLT